VTATFKSAETKVAKELRPARISPLSSASFAAMYSLVSERVSVTKVFASSANGSLSAPKTRAQLHNYRPLCRTSKSRRASVAVIDLHQNRLLAPKEHELGTSSGAYILGSARSSVTRG
jgi:hypothetical protein